MQHWGTYEAKGNHRAEAPRQECTCPTEEQRGGQGALRRDIRSTSRQGPPHARACRLS